MLHEDWEPFEKSYYCKTDLLRVNQGVGVTITKLNEMNKGFGNYLNLLKFPNSNKNSFCGNYIRKYGILNSKTKTKGLVIYSLFIMIDTGSPPLVRFLLVRISN